MGRLETYLDRVETSPFRHAGRGGDDRLGTKRDLELRHRQERIAVSS